VFVQVGVGLWQREFVGEQMLLGAVSEEQDQQDPNKSLERYFHVKLTELGKHNLLSHSQAIQEMMCQTAQDALSSMDAST
jgi:hypothetical protein